MDALSNPYLNKPTVMYLEDVTEPPAEHTTVTMPVLCASCTAARVEARGDVCPSCTRKLANRRAARIDNNPRIRPSMVIAALLLIAVTVYLAATGVLNGGY
jgi:uncharacterized paraquat-inducible protein A